MLKYLLRCVCCMYMFVCAQACVCVCACRGQRQMSGIFPGHSPPCFWSSISLKLELINLAWLAGPWAPPGVHQFPPPKCWGCRQALPFWLFYVDAADLNSGSHACVAVTLPTKPFPQPCEPKYFKVNHEHHNNAHLLDYIQLHFLLNISCPGAGKPRLEHKTLD